MERICALALCLLLSMCSARSPPKLPILTPLNCNETNPQVELATDLINEDRDEGFTIKPVRTKSIFEQKLENVPGGALYYINFEVQETKCSVLSGKKWKECSEEPAFHEQVNGECKGILYIAKPWRILKMMHYNCTLGTVPSRSIVFRCPDCPVIIKNINPTIKEKATKLVENFNKQDNNQTNHFKVDDVERVRTQYVFGQSFFLLFTIKETDCLKTQENVVLENCNSIEDKKAHVGFCSGSVYNTPEKKEEYSVACEIYDPRHDDDHHHHHHHGCGTSDHAKEGEEVKDNVEKAAVEAGGSEAGQGKDLPEKCVLGKDKRCGRPRGHKHHCHHPGHHHHHHPGHHHHHRDNHHDHQNHAHPHETAHNHTSAEHGSSEESTDKQHFRRIKGSVHVYYLDEETPSPPVPTILRLPTPGKHMLDIADFPNEPSPLETCPSPPK